jgi:hypothetical protein
LGLIERERELPARLGERARYRTRRAVASNGR